MNIWFLTAKVVKVILKTRHVFNDCTLSCSLTKLAACQATTASVRISSQKCWETSQLPKQSHITAEQRKSAANRKSADPCQLKTDKQSSHTALWTTVQNWKHFLFIFSLYWIWEQLSLSCSRLTKLQADNCVIIRCTTSNYLLQPLCVVLHDMFQLLDLLVGEVRLRWRGVPLQSVGIVLSARFKLSTRSPGASVTLWKNKSVAALSVLDPVVFPTAAVAARFGRGASRSLFGSSFLLTPCAVRHHQQCRQRRTAAEEPTPPHGTGWG